MPHCVIPLGTQWHQKARFGPQLSGAIPMQPTDRHRFDTVIAFVYASQRASGEQPARAVTENRDFFRNIASNLSMKDGIISWMPRGAWKTVVAIGPLARQQNAASCDVALFADEIDHINKKRREWDSNPR
jgi:hypothetical protein